MAAAIPAPECGWSVLRTTQRAAWDEIREAARWALKAGEDYHYCPEGGTAVSVATLGELAVVTRHERAWLGRWWPEDRGRSHRA